MQKISKSGYLLVGSDFDGSCMYGIFNDYKTAARYVLRELSTEDQDFRIYDLDLINRNSVPANWSSAEVWSVTVEDPWYDEPGTIHEVEGYEVFTRPEKKR